MTSGPARWAVRTLSFYRTAISPAFPPRCRFTPTCSAYAVEAIERFGLTRGSWLALRRLLRCHPFHAGGHDPVPSPVLLVDSTALARTSAAPASCDSTGPDAAARTA